MSTVPPPTVARPVVLVAQPGVDVDPRLLGGKGAALQTLRAHGIPVPPFAVVTTEAFGAGDDASVPDLERQIIAAASAVAGDTGRVVVRSSATVEDRPGSSFAGQFRSVLDVAVPDEVMSAVRSVWRSLGSTAAQTYRRQAADTPGPAAGPAMAVVIMRQVEAQRSGVAFTRDPTGDPETIRVEAVEGTGDRLVSGAVTPEVFGAVREGDPVADPVIGQVVELALRCEAVFGEPQDVEWAWDGHQVHIVQSRPITHRRRPDPGPEPEGDFLTTAGLSEMLPGVMPPLVGETAVLAIDHAFVALLHALGALPTARRGTAGASGGLVTLRGGRAGLRLDLLAEAASRLPSTSPEHLEAQLVGRRLPDGAAPETGPWWRRATHDLRAVRLRRRAMSDAEVVLAAVEHLVAARPAQTIADRDSRVCWQMRRRVTDVLMRTAEAEVAVAALAASAFERLVGFLATYVDDDASRLAVDTMAAGVTSPQVERWMALCERWRGHPAGRAALEVDTWAMARSGLEAAGEPGRALLHDLMATARRAGSRAVPGGTTWDDDLDATWSAVRAAASVTHRRATARRRGDDDPLLEQLSGTRRWTRRRVLTGWVIDSQSIVLGRHRREVHTLLGQRERLKDALLCVGGEVHRVDTALGRALLREGRLAPDVPLEELGLAEVAARVGRAVAATSPVLRGWPVSAGRYEGRARVVTSADDPFEPGEVLVARATDPSWSPLFMAAGALVVEVGGALSHAAVIARELGLPGVVNVTGLTERVVTGMRVRVDGDRGSVEIIEDTSGEA